MIKRIDKSEKVVGINALTGIVAQLQQQGQRVVHCHGCFDFLHLGHLRHFKEAKTQGEVLIVTVTLDQYVNKGPGRPFYTAEDRAEMLSALEIVDYVCFNPWPTASETIETLKPDVFVKGKEYSDGTAKQDARFRHEVAALKKVGGAMFFTDDVVLSSSAILNDLQSA